MVVLLETFFALYPQSGPNVYYRILISFDKKFIWQYMQHYLSVFIELSSLVPLFLFAFKKTWLPAGFWKIFFFVRILGIFIGNFYEANLIGTMLIANKLSAIIMLLIGFIIILPSYIAIFLYGFKKK